MIYKKSVSEKELRVVAREAIKIIHGNSEYAGSRPFYCGKSKLRNTYIHHPEVKLMDKNVQSFQIIKNWEKKGQYTLVLEGHGKEFEIHFNTKTTEAELYVLLGDVYDEYEKSFYEFEINLNDGNKIKGRTNTNIDNVRKYYTNKWLKNDRWYALLAKGSESEYPQCTSVTVLN